MKKIRVRWQNLWFWLPVGIAAFLIFSRFAASFSPESRTGYNPVDDIPGYPFVNTDENRLKFPGGKQGFNRFFARLDTLTFYGEGKINIMHIGGSHVQGGTLTARMRDNMNTLTGGMRGERGFLFPFRLAHTNNPRNFKVSYTGKWKGCRSSKNRNHCPWGLAGITATTYDNHSRVMLYAFDKDSVNYPFNAVKIYHLPGPDSFDVKPDSSMKVDTSWTDTVAGFTAFRFAVMYDTLIFETFRSDSLQKKFVLQGIKLENDRPGISYTAIGVNGAKVPSYLRCPYFEPQLATAVPDLVILGIGINDSYMPEDDFSPEEYEDNYRRLLNIFRRVNPDVQFLFLTNNDSYYKRRFPNANVYKVRKSMEKLAAEYGAAYWDFFAVMGGYNSIRMWEYEGLAKHDLIHFTPAGYVLQADLLFKSIRDSYGDYLAEQSEFKP